MSPSEMVRTHAVIFDGDDTLWQTQILYDEAKEDFFNLMGELGFSRNKAEELLSEVDVKNVSVYGFSKRRFPNSMKNVYELLCQELGITIAPRTLKQIEKIGLSVFRKKAPIVNRAKEILTTLKEQYRLFLFTAGDRQVQLKRIKDVSISGLFEAIVVTDKKTDEQFRKIIQDYHLDPHKTWMVGNSLKSDINPALRIGIKAIWIKSSSWEYEQDEEPQGQVWQISSLEEIESILAGWKLS